MVSEKKLLQMSLWGLRMKNWEMMCVNFEEVGGSEVKGQMRNFYWNTANVKCLRKPCRDAQQEMWNDDLKIRQMFRIWRLCQGLSYLDRILKDEVVLDLPKGKTRPIEYCLGSGAEYPCSNFYYSPWGEPQSHSILLHYSILSLTTHTHTYACTQTHTCTCMHNFTTLSLLVWYAACYVPELTARFRNLHS